MLNNKMFSTQKCLIFMILLWLEFEMKKQKGFALFGHKKYALVVHVFDIALRECDIHDKVFVLLIKVSHPSMYPCSLITFLLPQSVVLFEVRYHAESMACIPDLMEHCPVESKSASLTVQGGVLRQGEYRTSPNRYPREDLE